MTDDLCRYKSTPPPFDLARELAERIHQPNQFGTTPFNFKPMAPSHLLQIIANRAAARSYGERLFDFARYPFLAANQKLQLL